MITLYTAGTPNGQKISIMLEELEVEYEVRHIHLQEGEQKEPWFLQLNPNGRIPVVVDHSNNDFVLFESGAILLYLAEKFSAFIPENSEKRFQVIQWLFYQMANVGPYQGQACVFYRYAPEKIPYAIMRYQKMTRDCYEVLNQQLADKEYLVDTFSIADIAILPWALATEWAGVSLSGLDNVARWIDTLLARPGVVRGLDIPVPYAQLIKDQTERAELVAKSIGQTVLRKVDDK